MSKIPSGFFAYSSRPAALPETIKRSIGLINDTGMARLDGWESLHPAGKFIIDAICRDIDERDIFACDLTYLNSNVLFELGYAIAKRKRIWIILDPSQPDAQRNYSNFLLVSNVGHSRYTNAQDIAREFFNEGIAETLDDTLYKRAVEGIVSNPIRPSLLYLRCELRTDASIDLTGRLSKLSLPITIDDPDEVSNQPLSWYVQNAFSACGVIAHLLDDPRAVGRLQNAKYALVSGLAYGFDQPLLMLAEEPYETPLDYRHILRKHETAAQCVAHAEPWLEKVEEEYPKQVALFKQQRRMLRLSSSLQQVSLGDPVAENEESDLEHYFVPTAAYNEALVPSRARIFIGRRGTGKSANLIKLAAELQEQRAYVCVVRPVAYELEGLLEVLRLSIPRAEQGFLVESLWKLLIYTELAKCIYTHLRQKPAHYEQSRSESAFMHFVNEHSEIILGDFSRRMDMAIQRLFRGNLPSAGPDQRAKISEILHENLIGDLRALLGQVLENEEVYVLVDNLDKAWGRFDALPDLSRFLLGLLNVTPNITAEFQRGAQWRRVSLSLIVFLRSDIYAYIRSVASEPDKITYMRMGWEETRVLERVIEERFVDSVDDAPEPEEVWEQFFEPTVKGLRTREYLVSRILPRPRDLIFWSKAALAYAINREHKKIEEADILDAEEEYSHYALQSLYAENTIIEVTVEDFFLEFLNASEIITRDLLEQFTRNAGIPEEKLPAVIEWLCDVTFLGLEVEPDSFQFVYDESKKSRDRARARKMAAQRGVERFAINKPFHAFLGIKPS